jgi:hypothetical protein
MAEVTQHAARQAASTTKATVRVRNRVVPMEHAETYYAHEIASEGQWSSGHVPIIVRPPVDAGQSRSDWFANTLERMRETRRRKGVLPISVAVAGGDDIAIDVGLVDVTVFFEMPPGFPPSLPGTREEFDMALTENFRHFDLVCGGALHDQLIVATVPHFFHSDGSPLLLYHNLIFGLRQEVRDTMDILGLLDTDSLFKALSKSGHLKVIGGIKR